MSEPISPILSNSAFSKFDYFSTGEPTPIFTLSLTTSPTSSSSLPHLQSTPERGKSTSPCPSHNSCTSVEIEFGSPQVLSSPRLSVKKDTSSARRSVQFCKEKEKTAVNWARPLKVEQDPMVSMRLFGASLQRSRRLNRSSAPSPSSSDDEPLTPSPITPSSDDNIQVPLRGWSVFSSGAKGLGVSGVAEWDTPVTPLRELTLEELSFGPLEISSSSITPPPIKKSGNLPRSISKPILQQAQPIQLFSVCSSSNSRILATSQSLNSFSSPSNLQELRNLRQAAVVLENEAKKPIPIRHSPSYSQSQIKEIQRERKIKRKAVPSIAESDIIDFYSNSSSSSSHSSSSPCSSLATPSSSSCSSSSPNSIVTSSTSSSLSQEEKQRRRNSSIDQIFVARQLPGMGMGDSIFNRHRQLYQNHLATRSVIEISPNSIAVSSSSSSSKFGENDDTPKMKIPNRIVSSPPISSPSKCRYTSDQFNGLEESINLSSSSSSSFSEHTQPITPNSKITNSLSASQTEYFLNSVENAFKKLEFERAELQQHGINSPSTNTISNVTISSTSSKHKRGFSRFLGKKGSSIPTIKDE